MANLFKFTFWAIILIIASISLLILANLGVIDSIEGIIGCMLLISPLYLMCVNYLWKL